MKRDHELQVASRVETGAVDGQFAVFSTHLRKRALDRASAEGAQAITRCSRSAVARSNGALKPASGSAKLAITKILRRRHINGPQIGSWAD